MRTKVTTTISPCIGGNLFEFQANGWSEPEPTLTWMIGDKAELWVPNPGGNFFLEIDLCPFTCAALPVQRLIVEIGGRIVAREVSRGAQNLAWEVPAVPEPMLHISFHCPDSSRPSELGASTDTRKLGFCATSIRLSRGCSTRELTGGLSCLRLPQDSGAAVREIERLLEMPATSLFREFGNLIGNCEFPFFQRRMDAEIMGLLTFAGAYPLLVERGIPDLFAGIGENPDRLHIEAPQGHEWHVCETQFNLWYHTFATPESHSHEQMLEREARRLRFLARKFRDSVRNGRQIFVVRDVFDMPQSELLSLLLALNRHGHSRLLWVRERDGLLPPGGACEVFPGIVRAHIETFAPNEHPGEAPLVPWAEVCLNAWRAFQPPSGQA